MIIIHNFFMGAGQQFFREHYNIGRGRGNFEKKFSRKQRTSTARPLNLIVNLARMNFAS